MELRKYITEVIMMFLGIVIASSIGIIPNASNTLYLLVIVFLFLGIISMLVLVYFIKKINEQVDLQSGKKMILEINKIKRKGIVPNKSKLKRNITKELVLKNIRRNIYPIIITSVLSLTSIAFLVYSSFIQEDRDVMLSKRIESVLANDTLISNKISHTNSEIQCLTDRVDEVTRIVTKLSNDTIP